MAATAPHAAGTPPHSPSPHHSRTGPSIPQTVGRTGRQAWLRRASPRARSGGRAKHSSLTARAAPFAAPPPSTARSRPAGPRVPLPQSPRPCSARPAALTSAPTKPQLRNESEQRRCWPLYYDVTGRPEPRMQAAASPGRGGREEPAARRGPLRPAAAGSGASCRERRARPASEAGAQRSGRVAALGATVTDRRVSLSAGKCPGGGGGVTPLG